MSELKVYMMPLKTNIFGKTIVGQAYYSKSEADKVIAELEESHKKEVEQLLMEISGLKVKALQYKVLYKEMCRDINSQERHFAKQLYHNKYKRCLAIASKCRLRARWFGDNAFYKKERWALKWHRLWLELAEKSKEAKR